MNLQRFFKVKIALRYIISALRYIVKLKKKVKIALRYIVK